MRNDRIITRHKLSVERFGASGWFFVKCEDIPGLSSFSNNLDDALERICISGMELFQRRGKHVLITLDSIPEIDDHVWMSANNRTIQIAA